MDMISIELTANADLFFDVIIHYPCVSVSADGTTCQIKEVPFRG